METRSALAAKLKAQFQHVGRRIPFGDTYEVLKTKYVAMQNGG
jgi:hypothetical protein